MEESNISADVMALFIGGSVWWWPISTATSYALDHHSIDVQMSPKMTTVIIILVIALLEMLMARVLRDMNSRLSGALET